MYSLPLDLADPKESNPVRHDCGDHSSAIQHTYHHDDEDLSTVNLAARDFLNFPDILGILASIPYRSSIYSLKLNW